MGHKKVDGQIWFTSHMTYGIESIPFYTICILQILGWYTAVTMLYINYVIPHNMVT